MLKIITKSFIFLILTQMVILSGCSRRNSEIVLTEPDRTVTISETSGEATTDTSLDMESTSKESAEDSDKQEAVAVSTPALPETIMVHVCGAVLCEGVYELPTGSRVVDAVRAAGGFSEEADSEYVNQALVLADGVKVRIPTLEETVAAGQGDDTDITALEQSSDTAGVTGMYDDNGSASDMAGGKVNINTADETQLCTIPGIGPGRAKSIIAYREEQGRFGTIEDIMKVSGIKDKFFSKIKDYITV